MLEAQQTVTDPTPNTVVRPTIEECSVTIFNSAVARLVKAERG